jgi:hypothetical protein
MIHVQKKKKKMTLAQAAERAKKAMKELLLETIIF